MSVLHTAGRLSKQFVARTREQGVGAALTATRAYVGRRLTPPAPPAPPPPQPPPAPSLKDVQTHFARIALDAFLASGAKLDVPQFEQVDISILLVLYNRAELTLACLNSILATQGVRYEIILVDNASSDRTHSLLDRISGARILRNGSNLGFGAAVNQAAREARGEHVLLLNNDTELLGNSLQAALECLSSASDIGAVGAKILLLDGSLQEAGSIIWQDGTALGYGRGDSPLAAPYMFRRDVDFCSGAFLLTPRKLFLKYGFDPRFNPAYYEDVDYCVELWRHGWRVVYDPNVALLHYESASSATSEAAFELMRQKQQLFVEKQRDWLGEQSTAATANLVNARMRTQGRLRILLIDELLAMTSLGAGYPRANRLLHELRGLGHCITMYPLHDRQETWAAVQDEFPRDVEIMLGYGLPRLGEFLRQRRNCYDLVLVSRPTSMRELREVIARQPDVKIDVPIIYDAEALFCMREAKEREVRGEVIPPELLEQRIHEEVRLAEDCFSIVSVSPVEAKHFRRLGNPRVHILGHAIEVHPGATPFDQRHGLLFVGPIHDARGPNGDSARWMLEEVVPRLKSNIAGPILTFAGMWCENAVPAGADLSVVQVLGKVPDLRPVYDRSRVFVTPTRYCAGIPHKAHEAAAHGVPLVVTPLIAEQLGWRDEQELLVAASPSDFAAQCLRLHEDAGLWQRLRMKALEAVQRDCSRNAFVRRLQQVVEETLVNASRKPGRADLAA